MDQWKGQLVLGVFPDGTHVEKYISLMQKFKINGTAEEWDTKFNLHAFGCQSVYRTEGSGVRLVDHRIVASQEGARGGPKRGPYQ